MKFTIIKLLLVLGIALATFISLLYPAALTMPYKLLLAAGVLISVK
jgi:hypothetical protein